MKRLLIALLLAAPMAAQPRTPLSRALADALYIKLAGGDTVLGTVTFTNLTISGTCTGCGISGVAWGAITGTLSSQTDLQNALNLKSPNISPSFTTPSLGVATATSINGNVFTVGTGTLTLGAGKTTTFDHTSIFTTTDAQTYTFPTTSATLARTDTGQTFAGTDIFGGQVQLAAGTATTPTQAFSTDTGIGVYNIAASHIYAIHTGTDADLFIRANPAGTVNLEAANDAAGADVPLNIVGSTVAIKGGLIAITSGKTFTLNNSVTFAAGADGITETMPATSFSTARTDAAQSFTGVQSYSSNPIDTAQALTAGTMTVTNNANMLTTTTRFDWTNAMVTALGGVTAGDITVCTLPAKTVVKNMYVVIDTPDTSTNALTVAVGRTSATFIDYIVASDAKAAANTVYGDASGERGTNLVGYDLPSVTGTTAIKAHFIKTTTNLSTVLGSTGHIYIETAILP